MIKSLSAYVEQTAKFLRQNIHESKQKHQGKIGPPPEDLSLVNKIEQVAQFLRSKTR